MGVPLLSLALPATNPTPNTSSTKPIFLLFALCDFGAASFPPVPDRDLQAEGLRVRGEGCLDVGVRVGVCAGSGASADTDADADADAGVAKRVLWGSERTSSLTGTPVSTGEDDEEVRMCLCILGCCCSCVENRNEPTSSSEVRCGWNSAASEGGHGASTCARGPATFLKPLFPFEAPSSCS
jgi:hypothetical protein